MFGVSRLRNEQEITDELTKVNNHKGNAWAVFETDGDKVALAQESIGGRFGSFKSKLGECAPRGKACFGILKVRYPRVIGSNTPKDRALIVFVNQGAVIKSHLGMQKGMRVVMATASYAFPEFRKIQEAAVGLPVLEEHEDLDSVNVAALWGRWPSTSEDEKASFAQYMKEEDEEVEAQGAAGDESSDVPSVAPSSAHDTSARSAASSTPKASTAIDSKAIQVEVDKAMAKVTEQLGKQFEKTARKVAQDEVGRAIRKMGTDVGGKMSEIGSDLIKKASM